MRFLHRVQVDTGQKAYAAQLNFVISRFVLQRSELWVYTLTCLLVGVVLSHMLSRGCCCIVTDVVQMICSNCAKTAGNKVMRVCSHTAVSQPVMIIHNARPRPLTVPERDVQ